MAGEQPFDVDDENRGKNIKVCDRVIEKVPDVGFHASWFNRRIDLTEAVNDSVQERNVGVLAGHIVDVNSHGGGAFLKLAFPDFSGAIVDRFLGREDYRNVVEDVTLGEHMIT